MAFTLYLRFMEWIGARDDNSPKGFDHWDRTAKYPKTRKFFLDFPTASGLAIAIKTFSMPSDRIITAYRVNQIRPDKVPLLNYLYNHQTGAKAMLRGLPFQYSSYALTQGLALAINENTQERWLGRCPDNADTEYCYRALWAGASAKAIANVFTFGFDLAKIAMIPDIASERWVYKGHVDLMEKLYIEYGLQANYRTFWYSTFVAMIYGAAYFGGYEICKLKLADQQVRPTFLQSYGWAQLCASSAAILTEPFDPVRRRMIYQDYKFHRVHYKGIRHCFKDLIRYKGPGQLVNSMHIALIKSVPAAILLAWFDQVKYQIRNDEL